MPVFAVHYDYREDTAAARDQHRPAHRAFLDTLTGPAELLASGPYAQEPAGALLIFRAESAAAIEQALDADPFAVEDVIERRTCREWSQAKGIWAG